MRFCSRTRLQAVILLCAYSAGARAFAAQPAQPGQYRDIQITPTVVEEAPSNELRVDSQELAELLGIEPLVLQLKAVKSETNAAQKLCEHRYLQERVLCLWQIELAAEEVRKLVADINNEESRSYSVVESLSDQISKLRNDIDTLNFTQIGVMATIKQSLRLGHQPLDAVQAVSITFSANSIVLALASLAVPGIVSKPISPTPNTLARFLYPKYHASDTDESCLWRFFNKTIPGSNSSLTRREILIKHWDELLELRSSDARGVRKIIEMPDENENLVQRIDILNKRILILRDLKSHVEEFDRALYHLHKEFRVE